MPYLFPEAWAMYPKSRAPFMYDLFEEMKQKKPYKGLKILHNLPLMVSDLLKIDCLVMSGAEITITMPKFVKSDLDVIDLVRKSPLKFIEEHKFTEQYDISLDCCCELGEIVVPRIGSVEITQTGAIKYRAKSLSYPVVSVDDSQLKFLEDSVGSVDGLMRALDKLIKDDLHHKKFVVFGFGKVGVGIAREFKKLTNDVVVIDKSPERVALAKNWGYLAINADDKELVYRHVADAFCVVTATGVKGLISREYDKKPFLNKHLVNIGALDEFGERFNKEEVFNDKMPVNFVLKDPTKMEYLDPVYYAHNTCIDLLLEKNFNAGVHPLPKQLDNQILDKWFAIHGDDRQEFNKVVRQLCDYVV